MQGARCLGCRVHLETSLAALPEPAEGYQPHARENDVLVCTISFWTILAWRSFDSSRLHSRGFNACRDC